MCLLVTWNVRILNKFKIYEVNIVLRDFNATMGLGEVSGIVGNSVLGQWSEHSDEVLIDNEEMKKYWKEYIEILFYDLATHLIARQF